MPSSLSNIQGYNLGRGALVFVIHWCQRLPTCSSSCLVSSINPWCDLLSWSTLTYRTSTRLLQILQHSSQDTGHPPLSLALLCGLRRLRRVSRAFAISCCSSWYGRPSYCPPLHVWLMGTFGQHSNTDAVFPAPWWETQGSCFLPSLTLGMVAQKPYLLKS